MPVHAAQYLRMSTEKQPMSIETQREAIRLYADASGYSVVETYVDEACSGVRLAGRKGMQRLLKDVLSPECGFKAILVLDVSRWGRFQDVDESAYYEYHCRKNGVEVVYVSESFRASTSPLDSIIKQLKRTMAAEYSRELAHKSRAGQMTIVNLGFATGNLPCLGYRRVAVSQDGSTRMLAFDERKPRLTDRIKWVLGPDDEVATVQWIFDEYAGGRRTLQDLWSLVTLLGVRSHRGVRLTIDMLRRLLSNQIVTGRFTWGYGRESSSVTKIAPLPAPVVNDSMVAGIVDRDTWNRAQTYLCEGMRFRLAGFDNKFMLAKLRAALRRNPDLPSNRFVQAGLPSPQTYRNHFGSVTEAFRLARAQGCARERVPGRPCTGHAIKRYFVQEIFDRLQEAKVAIQARPRDNLITVGGTVVKVFLAHNFIDWSGTLRWKMNHALRPDQRGHWALVLCAYEGTNFVAHCILLTPDETKDVPSRVVRPSSGGKFTELSGAEVIARLAALRGS